MSLDFEWTCPDIDQGIESNYQYLKESFEEFKEAFLDGQDPDPKQWADWVQDNCNDIFEEVRSTNSSMRDAAERQINELLDKIDDLQNECRDWEIECRKLEIENNSLYNEKERLVDALDNLNNYYTGVGYE